jgi:hypothetical protein
MPTWYRTFNNQGNSVMPILFVTSVRAISRAALRAPVVFAIAGMLAAAPPVCAGGDHEVRATLLRNQEYADFLINGIREARTSIICSFYLFKVNTARGNQPRRIAEELIKARRRGVEVSVILEMQGMSKGDSLNADNHDTAALLSGGGVKVYFDSPRVTTHTKAVVIDNRFVYIGSHNLTQGALRYNNELSIFIDSPAMAGEIRAYLDRL